MAAVLDNSHFSKSSAFHVSFLASLALRSREIYGYQHRLEIAAYRCLPPKVPF